MTTGVALKQRMEYRYDRPVERSAPVIRLRPIRTMVFEGGGFRPDLERWCV